MASYSLRSPKSATHSALKPTADEGVSANGE